MDPDRQTLRRIKLLADEGNRLYYDWVRQMLTLTTGALMLLVALQGSFVPKNPRFLWLLESSWVGLALSITAAAIILHGRHGMCWRLAQHRLEQLSKRNSPDAPLGHIGEKPPLLYRIADRFLPWLLVLSVITLTLFALANLGRVQPKAKPDGQANAMPDQAMRPTRISRACFR